MNPTSNPEEIYQLGTWVGRQQALGLVAGRCTVAEMECLIEVYEKKLYLALEPTWDGYCRMRLGMSRRTAERLMRTYREQGPRVAKLNCFVRIRAAEYQIFNQALTDEGLVYDGGIIALEPENAPRLAHAVDAIRENRAQESDPPDPAGRAFSRAEKSLKVALAEFSRLRAMDLNEEMQRKLAASVEAGREELGRLSGAMQSS